jgi:hypothetical protein
MFNLNVSRHTLSLYNLARKKLNINDKGDLFAGIETLYAAISLLYNDFMD